jgi:DNA-binding NarL/FixJ family response regulator
MIKVAIADDQVLLREMLKGMLVKDPEIEVVGSAGDGAEVLRLCESRRPNVVLMDIKMPVADGFSALSQIKERWPAIKVVMLTTFHEDQDITDALAGGADGYVLKDIRPDSLVMAVRCAADDLCVIHRRVYDVIAREFNRAVGARLSVQAACGEEIVFDAVDRSIIRLIAEGKANKEIANAVHFAEGTVKNRISRMLAASGCKDRTHVVMFALRNGLL